MACFRDEEKRHCLQDQPKKTSLAENQSKILLASDNPSTAAPDTKNVQEETKPKESDSSSAVNRYVQAETRSFLSLEFQQFTYSMSVHIVVLV